MIGPRGYDLTALKRTILGTNKEVLARGLVVVGSTIGVLIFIGHWPVAVWTSSYVLWAIANAMVLRRLPDIVGYRGTAVVIFLEAAITLHWPVLFVYLWTIGSVGFIVIAMLIVAAAMTNAMGARSEDRILRTSDTSVVAVFMVLIVVLVWRDQADLRQTGVMAIVATLMMIWMVVNLREVSHLRQRMARAERDLLERQRIEAIGRLTGGVAHDFNNILTVIGGNLDLAAEVPDPTERAALLAEARRATDRAAGVTSQLLAYSRQSVLAPQEIVVSAAIDRVRAFLARLLPETIDLLFVSDADFPPLQLDETRFESALINLILNARDAIKTTGRIEVSARLCATIPRSPGQSPTSPAAAEGPFVCISVKDNGCGIPPEILSRVVEPYFTTKPVGRGSGLGLSMAKGFAEQSGGALQIISDPRVGTEVRMFFPAPRTATRAALMAAQ